MNKTVALLILTITIIVTLPIFFITIPVLIVIYNGLVKKKNQVQYAFSGVDVALQKRGELIPNLVESVKKYMDYEQTTLKDIVELRSRIGNTNPNSTQRFEMENKLTGLLKNLMVNVESYPDLKANQNMIHLQRTLNETEEQISASRRAYNSAVNSLNNAILTFPSNVLASLYNFKINPYFVADESAKITPNLKQLFN
ncbi:MAG TPA: LemA family protein [Flavobacterium sp.]|uniref:LemA family protein n=1 Tax=unclassified Flavobacterium TaxID=196869 RepID=UPI0025BB25CB|nr:MULTISPECIES: LemA family protein [unclassified Flavobacterium]HRE77984.1 LemA family protein [Flavobacterium sp.]